MKKVLSVLLAVLILIFSVSISPSAAPKEALPVSAGLDALRGQFESGVAPKTNGFKLDYEYYSPVGEEDTEKYPVVIFLHGIGHGGKKGSQLADSGMAYWSSQELQSRFSEGGAFILLPRAPENLMMFWGESFREPLRALIDDFIEQHKDNVDTTRIAISGSSQGGAMMWMMLKNYPEYFATAFPLASTRSPSTSTIKKCSSTAIWLLASKLDPVVNYHISTLTIWNKICKYNDNPENCRLSTFGKVYKPDGKRSSDNHHLASVITYDLHTLNDEPYPEMTTQNGLGEDVDLAVPEGLISWISSVHSDFTGESTSPKKPANILEIIVQFFRNIILELVHIFQFILGL
ncbi:MAG: prolyl oligopeptidase family serine peptidase [Clostridia bacterium]|nr:prolyl oligopeptidase family serine peptidase [Clostridia bacterium]